MSIATTHSREDLADPKPDGEPIAGNPFPLRAIPTIGRRTDALFRDGAGIFVAGDLPRNLMERRPDPGASADA